MLNIERYNNILQDIAKYSNSNSVSNSPSKCISTNITFIAVTKNQSTEAIKQLINIGHIHFGENRVEEASEKFLHLKQKYPQIVLHLIGPLQRNKVKQALETFDIFHCLDRVSLVDEVVKYKNDFPPKQYFLQVNIGGEVQKSGCSVGEIETLLSYCNQSLVNPGGLMCIPPAQDKNISVYFALAKILAIKHNLPFLSMGMSQDYKEAIKLGSTHLRIGSALFK